MMKSRYGLILGGGLALALAIYVLIQLASVLDRADPTETSTVSSSANQDEIQPASFSIIGEFPAADGTRRLSISGEAEPGAVVVLTDKGERLRQIRAADDGSWSLEIDASPAPMVIEAQLFSDKGNLSVRSDETIFRLPVPIAEELPLANISVPALLLVTSPGGASRIVQSPFGGLPTNGPLSLSTIDYDDTGGVIVSGTSSARGRIRVYASRDQGWAAIGETGISEDGRWNYIAGNMLPRGEYDIGVELIPVERGQARVALAVPFALLPPLPATQDDSGALSVKFEPQRWQVRRSLIGGGGQSTVIFAPASARAGLSEEMPEATPAPDVAPQD